MITNNLLDVGHWREKFKCHRKRLGKYWRDHLITRYPELGSPDGRRDVEMVAQNRANIRRTAKIVTMLEALSETEAPQETDQ